MDSHAGTKRNIDLNPICLEKLTQNEQRLKHKPYRKKKQKPRTILNIKSNV